jgi:hypothetical protein
MEITGKIYKKMPEQTGTGKNGQWVKQDFIIDNMEGQFPKKVCITVWGDKVEELKRYNPGDEVKVAINIESREYNDKWYTDVKAWKIERMGGGSSNSSQGPDSQVRPESEVYDYPANDDDLPF